MELEIVIKVVGVILATVGAAKVIYDLMIGKRGLMREEYRFAKEFLDDLSSDKKLHPFLRDKGYQAIAGDKLIGADEVEYLLTLVNSERALRDYILGRPYLEHLPNAGDLQVGFKKEFKGTWPLRWRQWLYGTLYFLLSFAAASPIFAPKTLFSGPGQMLVALLICLSLFGTYAWMALKAGTRIYRAKMLVKHQHKHTKRIVLSSAKSSFACVN